MEILNSSRKEFLKNYLPENQLFTSELEIELIKDKFNLMNYTPEMLIELRNDVVRFYDDLMDNEMEWDDEGILHRTSKFDDYLVAMQSVTSVIDYIKYSL